MDTSATDREVRPKLAASALTGNLGQISSGFPQQTPSWKVRGLLQEAGRTGCPTGRGLRSGSRPAAPALQLVVAHHGLEAAPVIDAG